MHIRLYNYNDQSSQLFIDGILTKHSSAYISPTYNSLIFIVDYPINTYEIKQVNTYNLKQDKVIATNYLMPVTQYETHKYLINPNSLVRGLLDNGELIEFDAIDANNN